MILLNGTRMPAAWIVGIDPSARERLVVVVKGTFLIPDDEGPAELAPESRQAQLIMADTFTGEPGYSAPIYEADFAWAKPRCDILVNGAAYAPQERPAARVRISVKVGEWQKVVDVLGDRVWLRRGLSLGPSAPQAFTSMPITFDRAFGGTDDTNREDIRTYMRNPVGRGYGLERSADRLIGRPVSNIEDPRDPVLVPWGDYVPMSLGPIARGWQPRLGLAGTFDQNWLENVFPFLPTDFDPRHFQAAPADQQIDEIRAGAEVVLLNLTAAGRTRFRLPTDLELPVVFFPKRGEPEHMLGTLDSLLIEPDHGTMLLIWRCARPLRRNIFEVGEVVVGRMSSAWWRARKLGKTYYPNLHAAVQSRLRDFGS
jgi:hypothetical protein